MKNTNLSAAPGIRKGILGITVVERRISYAHPPYVNQSPPPKLQLEVSICRKRNLDIRGRNQNIFLYHWVVLRWTRTGPESFPFNPMLLQLSCGLKRMNANRFKFHRGLHWLAMVVMSDQKDPSPSTPGLFRKAHPDGDIVRRQLTKRAQGRILVSEQQTPRAWIEMQNLRRQQSRLEFHCWHLDQKIPPRPGFSLIRDQGEPQGKKQSSDASGSPQLRSPGRFRTLNSSPSLRRFRRIGNR